MSVCKLKYLDYRVQGENEHSSFTTTKHIGNGVYSIKFDDGWESTATSAQLRSGAMKSPYYPSCSGVGFVGEGEFKTRVDVKEYQTWSNMIRRCYCKDYKEFHLYGGKGVVVCDEWKNFQNFTKWYKSNIKDSHVLDKDIKSTGNVYSPETCTSLPVVVNSFIANSCTKLSDNTYTGVYLIRDKYRARCSQLDGYQKHLGVYNTPEQAYNVYEKEKVRLANELADMYEDVVEGHVVDYLRSFDKHIRKLTINPYTGEEK